MAAYYNEFDPFAAQWLRNLIAAGHIAAGDVDERSIIDVRADDLRGYKQCHFFAGIGGWAYALRQSDWSDDRPVWTGSCPCQPFSTAGSGAGFEDARHLWPVWDALIGECRPSVVFGEQVANESGRAWLDIVWADMEGRGYAFVPVLLPACSVGAPHRRNRLWFVADSDCFGQLSETRSPAFHEEWDVAARRQGRNSVGNAPRAGLQPSWPPGLSGVSDISIAIDGNARNVGGVRAVGNAIVPQVAAAFVRAYMDVAARTPPPTPEVAIGPRDDEPHGSN